MKRNFYNDLLENVILPIGDWMLGTSFISRLKYWRAVCKLREDEINSLAEKNLCTLLNYATENISFYKKYRSVKDSNPYSWIKQFPIMKKEDIKNNLDDLISLDRDMLIKCSSSGSSGIQGSVYMSKHEQSNNRAIQILWWEWAGYKIGERILQTGMTSRGIIKKIKDILLRTYYVSAFSHSEEDINSILKRVSKHKYFFGGYASSLNLFAETALKNNIDNVKFESVISWGDKVFAHYHNNIRHAFKSKIYETYGASEGLMIGAKKDLDYFYIMSPQVYVEILDDSGKEVEDGQLGHVVVTRLDNFSMPLIRYYLGDLAIKLPKEKYPLNKEFNFPLLEKVIGRDTDIIKTKSGRTMIVHSFTGVFEYYPQIKQFMVIQENIDSILIKYIPDVGFSNNIKEEIEQRLFMGIDRELDVKWEEVTYIPPTPSGKPQIIQSCLRQ